MLFVKLRVQDFGDFIFEVIIYFDWGRRRLNPVWNCVRSFGFELGDVEHWIYCLELVWELESERSTLSYHEMVS